MTEELVAGLARQALYTTLLVAGPLLLTGLVAGLVIGVFQAATQINDQTLAYVPKIVVTLLAALFLGPWMLRLMTDFTVRLLEGLPSWVR